MKISISIDDELLKKVDEYKDKHFLKRSAVFSIAVGNLILQDEMVKTLKAMQSALETVSQGKELTDEDKEKMDQFEFLCKTIVQTVG